jgi:hypothetical protein
VFDYSGLSKYVCSHVARRASGDAMVLTERYKIMCISISIRLIPPFGRPRKKISNDHQPEVVKMMVRGKRCVCLCPETITYVTTVTHLSKQAPILVIKHLLNVDYIIF